jgi:predicted  nucleic acid-binding Zn-ribbon protein
MHKPVPACPKCGADQRETPAKTSPATERKRTKSKVIEPEAPAEKETEGAAEADDEEAAEDPADFADDDVG